MQVDRKRFLAVVALLSCTSCSSRAAAPPPPSVTVPPPPSPSAGAEPNPSEPSERASDAAAGPSANASTASSSSAGTDEDWGPLAGAHRELERLQRGAPPCDRRPVEQAIEHRRRSHSEETPEPLTAEAEPCQQLQEPPGPTCEDFPLIATGCFGTVSALEPTVARKAMQCLMARSGTRALCRRQLLDECVAVAARSLTPTPAAAPLCDEVVRLCRKAPPEPGAPPRRGPPLTSQQCQTVLSGVRCWSEWATVECLAEECSATRCLLPARWRMLEDVEP